MDLRIEAIIVADAPEKPYGIKANIMDSVGSRGNIRYW